MRTLVCFALCFFVSACSSSSNVICENGECVDDNGVCSERAGRELLYQGALVQTGGTFDVAIEGPGMFTSLGMDNVVRYTRVGNLRFDSKGHLCTEQGYPLLGYNADAQGKLSSELGQVSIPIGHDAKPTGRVRISAQLDTSAAIPNLAWDPQYPDDASNVSTSIAVYDGHGGEHKLTVYFRKTGALSWKYFVLVNAGELVFGSPGQNAEISSGEVTFSANGDMVGFAQTTPTPFVTFLGSQQQAIEIGSYGDESFVQHAEPSRTWTDQDGYSEGVFSNINIGAGGELRCYSREAPVSFVIAQLVTTRFRAVHRLEWIGSDTFLSTPEAGAASMGTPGTGGRGSLLQGNVEIAHTKRLPAGCIHR